MEGPAAPAPWLAAWSSGQRLGREAALARVLDLPAPEPAEMSGLWRGATLPSGHPLDGLLERLGWFGKAVLDPSRVHPLLFRRPSGRLVALEPFWMPAPLALRWPGLAGSAPCRLGLVALGPLLRARGPGACLEPRAFGGRPGLALVYRSQPIADHLRRAGPGRVVGVMEHPRMAQPFFFLLTREGADPGRGLRGTAAAPAHSPQTNRHIG